MIAVGDVDRDGHLDFWLGSSYKRAPWIFEDSKGVGAGSDLALQVKAGDGERVRFKRVALPDESGDFAKDPDSAPIPC